MKGPPEQPHSPVTGGAQAEDGVVHQLRKAGGGSINLGLNEIAVVVLKQWQGEAGRVRQETEQGNGEQGESHGAFSYRL